MSLSLSTVSYHDFFVTRRRLILFDGIGESLIQSVLDDPLLAIGRNNGMFSEKVFLLRNAD